MGYVLLVDPTLRAWSLLGPDLSSRGPHLGYTNLFMWGFKCRPTARTAPSHLTVLCTSHPPCLRNKVKGFLDKLKSLGEQRMIPRRLLFGSLAV